MGLITHPDALHYETEQLSIFVFMEKFINGAHPYFKFSIKSDNPDELGIQIFNQVKSADMQRWTITATMGNYSRLRLLYLKNKIIDFRILFNGYNGVEFDEKHLMHLVSY